MGTDRTQPLTLICNYPDARIYTLSVDLSNLKILDVEAGLDWALLVAYNRGKMESVKHSTIYNRFANLSKSCDMIIGYIVNDRMFVVLDRFFNGEITENNRNKLKQESETNRSKGIAMADEICRKYRRDGRFFDEILKVGE